MHDRENVQVQTVVQPPFTVPMLALTSDDLAQIDEGLSRIRNVQEHLEQVIERLAWKATE